MHGIGELFGSAFDDVLRRPTPVLVPVIVDVAALLAGAMVYAAALDGTVFYGSAPRALREMPFAVPEALPSVTQIRDPTGAALVLGRRAWLAVAAVALVTLPLLAYAQAGFVGLLLEAYLPKRDDPLAERPETLDEMKDAFQRHAHLWFRPMFVLRLVTSVVAVAAVVLPMEIPFFDNSILGLVAYHFLFIYAPFIVVVEGRRAFPALRESFRTVSTYLASSLVALLFGLLTLGGFAAILGPILRFTGSVGVILGAVLLAPLGTILTLFYLKVYLTLKPGDRLPIMGEASSVQSASTAEA